MTGSRPILTALTLAALLAAPAHAGIFSRKPKPDSQKAKQLVDALRSDSAESRRSAAAAELRDHDPKTNMDVLSALIGALQRDASAAVRRQAAVVLGEIEPYSAQAGLALERTAEGDRSPEVRIAAHEALWKYHLNGYKSQYFQERMHYQTPEPPLAKASVIKRMGGMDPPSVVIRQTPPEPISPARPKLLPSPVPTSILPSMVAPPGAVPAPTIEPNSRLLIRPTFPFNRTEEPPLARKRTSPMAGP